MDEQAREEPKKAKKEKPEETDEQRAARLRLTLEKMGAHKVTKAEKKWLAEYDEEQEKIRARGAAIHKLSQAADTYGRKQVALIKREVTNRVGGFSREESQRVQACQTSWSERIEKAKKRTRDEMKRLQESHQQELEGLSKAMDKDVRDIRAQFKSQYDEASDEIKERTTQTLDLVGHFTETVQDLTLEQLSDLVTNGVVEIQVGEAKEFLVFPGTTVDESAA